jgi:hypothetical protein
VKARVWSLGLPDESKASKQPGGIVIALPDHLIGVITLHTSVIPFPYSLFVTSELFRALA